MTLDELFGQVTQKVRTQVQTATPDRLYALAGKASRTEEAVRVAMTAYAVGVAQVTGQPVSAPDDFDTDGDLASTALALFGLAEATIAGIPDPAKRLELNPVFCELAAALGQVMQLAEEISVS